MKEAVIAPREMGHSGETPTTTSKSTVTFLTVVKLAFTQILSC